MMPALKRRMAFWMPFTDEAPANLDVFDVVTTGRAAPLDGA